MGIMDSTVCGNNVVTFDIGVSKRGDPVYRISWYNGHRWGAQRFEHFNEAYGVYKLICRMI